MINRRNGLIGTAVIALAIYTSPWSYLRSELEFTKPAPAALATLDVRPGSSVVQVVIPVDLARVAARAEDALAQRITQLAEAAQAEAAKRQQPSEPVIGARLERIIGQTGRVEIKADGNSVVLRLPVKIEVVTVARASGSSPEKSTTDTAVSVPFTANFGASGGFEIGIWDEPAVDGPQGRVAKQLEARLKPVASAALDELRKTLGVLPVRTATQRAWAGLLQPLELGAGSGTWLKSTPEHVGGGGFVSEGGQVSYRFGISARLAIGDADRGVSAVKRQPVSGQIGKREATKVRLAVPVRLDPLQKAVAEAFAQASRAGTLETKSDRFSAPLKVTVHATRAYPAAHLIGLELDLTTTAPDGQSHRGRAHLVGRPVLGPDNVITLADVTLTPAPQREGSAKTATTIVPRLGSEPFVALLTSAAKLDVARDIADAVPRVANLLHQRLEDRLSMSTKMTQAVPVSVETSRDGLFVIVDVVGETFLSYEGPDEQAVLVGGVGDRSSSDRGNGDLVQGERGAEFKPTSATTGTSFSGRPSDIAGAAGAAAASTFAATAIPSAATEKTKQEARPKRERNIAKRVVRKAQPGSTTAAAKGAWVPFPAN